VYLRQAHDGCAHAAAAHQARRLFRGQPDSDGETTANDDELEVLAGPPARTIERHAIQNIRLRRRAQTAITGVGQAHYGQGDDATVRGAPAAD